MTPDQFIEKWRRTELKERSASQSHFIDLCKLLGVLAPTDADPTGAEYCFERGATKTTGNNGWADVWKRGHFGWEYKGKRKDLDAAFVQLQQYAVALENPPLLVVCDMERFRIHTNWTNTVSEVHEIELEDLRDATHRDKLKWAFTDPARLKPKRTRDALTAEVAGKFADLAKRLSDRGHDPHLVAHFLNRLVFCMFAEDVDLLPKQMFTRMVRESFFSPAEFLDNCTALFRAMKDGGRVGFERVEWFNGGLFDDDLVIPLVKDDIGIILLASKMNWGDIDPSILGTLFERGLDPAKRGELGAHYTDRDKIMMIIDPVIIRPLNALWQAAKTAITDDLAKADTAKSPAARTKARGAAQARYIAFLDELRAKRVLDPACGSGNFLYLALLTLKDIEHKANLEAEAMGLERQFPQVGPDAVKGIELSDYAAELARVSIWIGEIQWMRRNGFDVTRNPILKPLETIENRDALLNPDGSEAVWPKADYIIGNPPFLGGKRMRDSLGNANVDSLFRAYAGRVPAEADLVCYWFLKAQEQMRSNKVTSVGLVSTNSIRGGANRRVLESLAPDITITTAFSDEPWILDGAAVRVSIVCFEGEREAVSVQLDGHAVDTINPDLTSTSVDLTRAVRLSENRDVAFMGDTKGGAFDVPGELARQWLQMPLNPNGRPNSDVLKPWRNGMDVTRRAADKWIIDFGWEMSEAEASLYEAPFRHAVIHVQPERSKNNRESYAKYWWRHVEARQGFHAAQKDHHRFSVTARVAKHRLFSWLPSIVLPDSATIAITRDDDANFGILHSRFHELWSLGMCTWLGKGNDPRYTPSTCFETFPFPEGLTPNIAAADYAADPRAIAIAAAAKRLDELRQNWLNPADLVKREPEVVPGYPDRILARDARAAAELKKRTLTNLYNQRPAWLANAHRDLDAAVAAAYGWPADLTDDEVLQHLFDLNQTRAQAGR